MSAPAGEPGEARAVSLGELGFGFLKIGLLGFGGVAPWARHIIVEERRWLSERDFASVLGLGQVLPGANTVNAAVMIGDRFQGWRGAAVALLALMAMPILVLVGLATIYDRFSQSPIAQALLAGAAAAAAGLVIGTACKMARRLRPGWIAILFGLAACAGIVALHLPILAVVLVLGPLSIAGAAWERRNTMKDSG